MISKSELAELRDKDYRHGLVNAQMEVDLPLEIRALRKQRGWTQPDLAEKADMKQPRISAMEKPGGANFTLETLKRLAKAFDVALIVKFAPFSELINWSDKFSPDEFSVPSFDEDLKNIESEANARDKQMRFAEDCRRIWATIDAARLTPEAIVDAAQKANQGIVPSWIVRQDSDVFASVAATYKSSVSHAESVSSMGDFEMNTFSPRRDAAREYRSIPLKDPGNVIPIDTDLSLRRAS